MSNYFLFSGGHTEIDAEGDGIDANGILTVSGGETYVSGPVMATVPLIMKSVQSLQAVF